MVFLQLEFGILLEEEKKKKKLELGIQFFFFFLTPDRREYLYKHGANTCTHEERLPAQAEREHSQMWREAR